MAERGITVSYESIRRWINHFGPTIASDLRKRRPKPYTSWHLDEVYLKIDGRMAFLWRAVDAEDEILDVLVQSKRDKHAALKLMRKLLKKYGFVPDRLDHRRPAIECRRRPRPWDREASRTRSVAQQPSGELASADPTTGTQDAGLQEPRIGPTISLNPCSRLQHLQRPTSSDISVDAPRLPRRGDGHLARGGRLRTYDTQLFAFVVQQRDKAFGGDIHCHAVALAKRCRN